MQHVNPKDKSRTALAPYNFVPLPDKILAAPPEAIDLAFGRSIQSGHSGFFDCMLETSTLLYIRGMLSAAEFNEKNEKKDSKSKKDNEGNSEFFSLDSGKTPTIPGTSLRGLLRGLVEIISCSQLSAVTNLKMVYRAVDTTSLGNKYRAQIMAEDPRDKHQLTPNVHAGFMRQNNANEWFIQPAKKIGGTTFCRIGQTFIPNGLSPIPNCRNAYDIYFLPGPYVFQDVKEGFLRIRYARAQRESASPEPGLTKGALIKSGPMKSKRSEAIVYPPASEKQVDWLPLRRVDPETGAVLVDLAREYINQVTPAQASLLGPQGVLNDGQPVFYLLNDDGTLKFFGHTMMMRIPFAHNPSELLPDSLPDGLFDLASTMFGVARLSNNTFSGRVQVSDATFVSAANGLYEEVFQPRVLSTPKPTTFQHYVSQDKPDQQGELIDYDSPKARLRGHKVYWHKGNVKPVDIRENDEKRAREHSSQYTKIQPLRAGVRFRFRVYFDQLSDVELGALLWLFEKAADPAYRLKLGMGKPLGMGAIQVTHTVKLFSKADRYARLFDGNSWQSGLHDSRESLLIALRAFVSWASPGQAIESDVRIASLLTLLRWEGPNSEKTRYMEIERRDDSGNKLNEYKTRPVLPDPFGVVGHHAPPRPTEPVPTFQRAEVRGGMIIEYQTNRNVGKLRDTETNKEYRFDLNVIQGNRPAQKTPVKYGLANDRVVWVKK
jgi:CRISPR-associated protein (TIGR03986 family)